MIVPGPSAGQPLTGARAVPEYKYSTPMPPGIAVPDKVETRLGTFRFEGKVHHPASLRPSGTVV